MKTGLKSVKNDDVKSNNVKNDDVKSNNVKSNNVKNNELKNNGVKKMTSKITRLLVKNNVKISQLFPACLARGQ